MSRWCRCRDSNSLYLTHWPACAWGLLMIMSYRLPRRASLLRSVVCVVVYYVPSVVTKDLLLSRPA